MDPQLKAIIDRAIADGASDEDIDLLVQEHRKRAPEMTPEQRRQSVLESLQLPRTNMLKEHPVQTIAMLAIPAAMSLGAKFGPPLLQSAISKIATPTGGAVVGAAEEGIRTKGDLKSMAVGAGSGYLLGGKAQGWLDRLFRGGVDPVAAGMSQAARPPVTTSSGIPANIDDMMAAAIAKQKAANPNSIFHDSPAPTAVARPAMTPQQMLQQEIDWRLTDAVPINAMSRKGILEAGESIPGLGDRAAAAAKAGDATEVERLLRAIRQRQHITAKAK